MRTRKIKDFRNRCVCHIWDTKKQRPLAHSEVMIALSIMVPPDLDSFLNWINKPKDNIYPNTVISVFEAVRDELMSFHGLMAQEIINR